MKKAISRGIWVTLIVETVSIVEMGAKQSLLRSFRYIVGKQASFYHRPIENRPKNSKSRTGSLHVKCALRDKKTLLLSSANLTGHACNLNMKMGILIRNVGLAGRVWGYFNSLVSEENLLVFNTATKQSSGLTTHARIKKIPFGLRDAQRF